MAAELELRDCLVDGCEVQVEGLQVCQAHVCAVPGCPRRQIFVWSRLSPGCFLHTCMQERCVELLPDGGRCPNHKCKSAGCRMVTFDGQEFCPHHTCGTPGCGREVSAADLFCVACDASADGLAPATP